MIFEIDTTSDVPLWVQLRQRIVHLINNGHYSPGDQLPTVRGLASELSINYNTVNKAYLSMIQDGYLTSTRGRGVFVGAASEADEELVLEAEGLLDELIGTFRDLGLSSWEVRKLFAKRLRSLDAARDEAAAGGPAEAPAAARPAAAGGPAAGATGRRPAAAQAAGRPVVARPAPAERPAPSRRPTAGPPAAGPRTAKRAPAGPLDTDERMAQ
jgi:GntR family transcriptional regulator